MPIVRTAVDDVQKVFVVVVHAKDGIIADIDAVELPPALVHDGEVPEEHVFRVWTSVRVRALFHFDAHFPLWIGIALVVEHAEDVAVGHEFSRHFPTISCRSLIDVNPEMARPMSLAGGAHPISRGVKISERPGLRIVAGSKKGRFIRRRRFNVAGIDPSAGSDLRRPVGLVRRSADDGGDDIPLRRGDQSQTERILCGRIRTIGPVGRIIEVLMVTREHSVVPQIVRDLSFVHQTQSSLCGRLRFEEPLKLFRLQVSVTSAAILHLCRGVRDGQTETKNENE